MKKLVDKQFPITSTVSLAGINDITKRPLRKACKVTNTNKTRRHMIIGKLYA